MCVSVSFGYFKVASGDNLSTYVNIFSPIIRSIVHVLRITEQSERREQEHFLKWRSEESLNLGNSDEPFLMDWTSNDDYQGKGNGIPKFYRKRKKRSTMFIHITSLQTQYLMCGKWKRILCRGIGKS